MDESPDSLSSPELQYLEFKLQKGPFLVRDTPTLADLVLFCYVQEIFVGSFFLSFLAFSPVYMEVLTHTPFAFAIHRAEKNLLMD